MLIVTPQCLAQRLAHGRGLILFSDDKVNKSGEDCHEKDFIIQSPREEGTPCPRSMGSLKDSAELARKEKMSEEKTRRRDFIVVSTGSNRQGRINRPGISLLE